MKCSLHLVAALRHSLFTSLSPFNGTHFRAWVQYIRDEEGSKEPKIWATLLSGLAFLISSGDPCPRVRETSFADAPWSRGRSQ